LQGKIIEIGVLEVLWYIWNVTGIDCDNLVWSLDQRDVYRLVLDTCLAPKLTTTKSVPPHITQVAWSPAGMLQYGRYLGLFLHFC